MEELFIYLLHIFLVVYAMITLLLFLGIFVLLYTRVPYAPVPLKWISIIFDELNVNQGSRIYDLGAGDGRFVIFADRLGCDVVGFELSPYIYLRSRWNIWRKKSHAKIFYRNFYDQNYSDADIVYFFLTKKVIQEVKARVLDNLKEGVRVVSYGTEVPELSPYKVIDTDSESPKASKIYFYRV